MNTFSTACLSVGFLIVNAGPTKTDAVPRTTTRWRLSLRNDWLSLAVASCLCLPYTCLGEEKV